MPFWFQRPLAFHYMASLVEQVPGLNVLMFSELLEKSLTAREMIKKKRERLLEAVTPLLSRATTFQAERTFEKLLELEYRL